MHNKLKMSEHRYRGVIFVVCFFWELILLSIALPDSVYLVPVTEALGIGRTEFNLIFSIRSVTMLLGSLVYGRIYSRFGSKRMMVCGTVLMVTAYLIYSQATAIWMFYIGAVVFGIGVNGHVALNEPGVDPTLRTHVAQVAPVTATVAQKYFRQEAPPLTQGVSMGIGNAAEAKALFLVANTAAKKSAVEAIEELIRAGEPSRDVPASFIAAMPQAQFLVTEAVFA